MKSFNDGRKQLSFYSCHAYCFSTSAPLGGTKLKWLAGTPAAVAKLETYLGPYPFKGLGGIVPGTQFRWGGIEAAMRYAATLGHPAFREELPNSHPRTLHT